MTSIQQARLMHANLYLNVVETADQFFSAENTQGKGVSIFDRNRGQIDAALEWLREQNPTNERDVFFGRFVDALSTIGMVRYSVPGMLIPLSEEKILSAQRLGMKELEADALDGLGILYAFLGYIDSAIQHFQSAYEIADQINHRDLKREIKAHLDLARKQLSHEHVAPHLRFSRAIQLIPLYWKLFLARISKSPFVQVNTLNKIAGVYSDLGKLGLSVEYYQRALSISKEHSYRFGEMEASIGLLYAEASKKGNAEGLTPIAGAIGNIANEFGFEWGTDFSVFEILLEIAPTIKDVEIIASRLAKNNDPRANEIYRLLDQIMVNTNEIVSATYTQSANKHELFINSLGKIKDDLASIVEISSRKSS